MKGKPIDVVMALLPTLSDKEKEQVIKELGVHLTPCDRLGHAMKPMKKEDGWFFTRVTMVCARCGKVGKV